MITANIQNVIARAVARTGGEALASFTTKEKNELGHLSDRDIELWLHEFLHLKEKAIRGFPEMRWGASVQLDDIKVARFAFDAARQNEKLDEAAVQQLVRDTWSTLHK